MYAGTDERSSPITYQPNHLISTSQGGVLLLSYIVELYLEVKDAEIESTMMNLNPRVDTAE